MEATTIWKNCAISIDGTDVPIEEPKPFSTSWYSHKFCGPGLRYELGVSIKSGNICWVNGPFPCGSHPDDKIFRLGLLAHLGKGNCVVADRGYKHPKCVTPDTRLLDTDDSEKYKQILARHETVNRLLKRFLILSHRFRHSIHKHRVCFMAVVNIVTLCIKHGLLRTFEI